MRVRTNFSVSCRPLYSIHTFEFDKSCHAFHNQTCVTQITTDVLTSSSILSHRFKECSTQSGVSARVKFSQTSMTEELVRR